MELLYLFLVMQNLISLTKTEFTLVQKLKDKLQGPVYKRGTLDYHKRRFVHNGLCENIFPDVIVVPKSTEDVSEIVKITNEFNISISVRSGGHSYTCTSIRQGGVHIDMRSMNKIELVSPHLAVLGPGSIWYEVLQEISPLRYTMLHGQCESVGVGGYILGGGINVIGTYEKYGTAAEHVKQYTMVDSKGNILLISNGNTTVIEPYTRKALYQIKDDYGLFFAMKGAGSSMGITTEFLYKIYPRPETLPCLAYIFVENGEDLKRIEKAAQDTRYQLSLYSTYVFRDMSIRALNTPGLKILPKLLKIIAFKKVEPILINMVDMSPQAGRFTNRRKAYDFLKEYDIKLAMDGLFAEIIPNHGQIGDYENLYMSSSAHQLVSSSVSEYTLEFKSRGFQPIATANMLGLSSLDIFQNFFFYHPVFGLFKKESDSARKAGCEFCFLAIVSSKRLANPNIPLNFSGKFQFELSCMFPKEMANSNCPKVLKNVKENLKRKAIILGDKPMQYPNTPSCDKNDSFKGRYFSLENYKKLLKTKKFWDPSNKFNHCQSIGNNDENCCPV